jgi:hypothetical protein
MPEPSAASPRPALSPRFERMAWLVMGRLIMSDLIAIPDLNDPLQVGRLYTAVTELGWVLEDLCR